MVGNYGYGFVDGMVLPLWLFKENKELPAPGSYSGYSGSSFDWFVTGV